MEFELWVAELRVWPGHNKLLSEEWSKDKSRVIDGHWCLLAIRSHVATYPQLNKF